MDNLIWFTAGMLAAGLLDWWLIVGSRWKRKAPVSPYPWPMSPEEFDLLCPPLDSPEGQEMVLQDMKRHLAAVDRIQPRSKPQHSTLPESGRFSVQVAGPKPYGMPLAEWLSANPEEIRAHSGTAAGAPDSSNSRGSGSDTRERVRTIGPTPLQTPEPPTRCISTTLPEGSHPGSNGVASPDEPCACFGCRQNDVYQRGDPNWPAGGEA